MSIRAGRLLGLVLAVLALAACGGGTGAVTGPAPDTDGSGAGAPAPGGGLSIEEALATTATGPLLVTGHLVAPTGEPARLCSALLESYPPQCGEPSIVVEGLDLRALAGLSRTNDPSLAQVTWSDATISVLGELAGGVLTVSATSQ